MPTRVEEMEKLSWGQLLSWLVRTQRRRVSNGTGSPSLSR